MTTTTQTETTLLGTCQICQRPTFCKSGVIAHHGYQRPGYGYQTSSCPGARYAALEIACDRIPTVVAGLRASAIEFRAAADRMMTTPPASFTKLATSYRPEQIIARPEGFDAAATIAAQDYRTGRYEDAFVSLHRSNLQNAAACDAQADRLDAIAATWAPGTLRTVEQQARLDATAKTAAKADKIRKSIACDAALLENWPASYKPSAKSIYRTRIRKAEAKLADEWARLDDFAGGGA